MKIIIIEDEKPAADKLIKTIHQAATDVHILAWLNSVESATKWLQQHEPPDLIFMDIQLGDGLSFEIFDQVTITCPVIFCTAYDEYWQEAFEHNSIDYLLKPVKTAKLSAAMQKYEQLQKHFAYHFLQLQKWRSGNAEPVYKNRFLVKRGIDYISIPTEEIAYFYASNKLVCLVNSSNQKFFLDQSLSDIEKQTDPACFYRVNRKFLVQQTAIAKIKSYPKSKLQVELMPQ
ncbi:MAG: response regulator transcription factor, partial [Chitinophagaceae bacterium]|nr:response regulator transcription factor [Chitinophagaceae bacterium]